jgi:hypothetical protein
LSGAQGFDIFGPLRMQAPETASETIPRRPPEGNY